MNFLNLSISRHFELVNLNKSLKDFLLRDLLLLQFKFHGKNKSFDFVTKRIKPETIEKRKTSKNP